MVESIYQVIRRLKKDTALSDDDVFYVSVYDYWLYGFTVDEIFYLGLLDKTEEEKRQYISHMDRINYMHHVNKKEDEHFLTDKYETYKLLKEYYGRELICLTGDSDFEDFRDFFSRHEKFVIKPIGMATSIGVSLVSRADYDNNAETAFKAIFEEIGAVQKNYKWAYGSGVILEEVIKQSEQLHYLHPASINSVRLTTVRHKGGIAIFYPVLRIGMGGQFLCCGAVGSILTGINVSTGICETDGYNEWNEHYETHPNSGVTIKGITIPKWKELCSLAVTLANKFDTLGYIGWDFVYTSDEKWIVMEANENGEFLGQIAYQKGLLKDFQELIEWKSPKEYWWIGKYDK